MALPGSPEFRHAGPDRAGHGIESGKHAASLCAGSVGVLHGSRTYLLQDAYGQVQEAHSISAGLDYPGVGPEHSYLKETGRASYVAITDDEAVEAFQTLCRTEGIIPALESAHAVAYALRLAPELGAGRTILVDWQADYITFYVDGQVKGKMVTPESLKAPMYIIADMSVGSNWVGYPDSSTVLRAPSNATEAR